MEICPTHSAESLDSDKTSNPTKDDVSSCAFVDLTDGQDVVALLTPVPTTKSLTEEVRSVFAEGEHTEQISQPPNDASSCQNRVETVLISDTDSDESSSTDTCDSSDDSLDIEIRRRSVELRDEIDALKNHDPPKVAGEITLSELPPVEDLCMILPDHATMHAFGRVSQIMIDNSVVIQSFEGMPALDQDTVLFFSHRKAFGKVEETFGPVATPYYIVRFNSKDHLSSKEVELGKEVFYAPDFHDLTSYVFLSTLRKMRGSDASWLNDKEPPPNLVDYSDDEEERREKKAMKNKGKNKQKRDRDEDTTKDAAIEPPDAGRNFARQNRWHNESRRVNVLPPPNPAFEGWNAAVNRMGCHRMRPAYPYSPPVFGQPTSTNGMPFPPMRAPHPFPTPPPMDYNYGGGNFMGNCGPRHGWLPYPPQFNNGPGMFSQPPPPPPPPPP